MPGGIDPHVHLHHVWIKPDGTPLVTAGPEQVGRAALFGGTTTFIDFAYWRDGMPRPCRPSRRATRTSSERVPCDWAYHIMLHSEPPPEFSGQLAEAIQAGYPTLKIFTTNILPSRSGRMIDFGDIWEAFQVLAKEGGLGVIHAEDNDIVMHMYAKLIRENRVELRQSRRGPQSALGGPELSPHPAARRKRARHRALHDARFRRHGCRGDRRGARARVCRSTARRCINTCCTRQNDYKRPNGQIYHTYPSLKSQDDQKALWHGTANDVIHCVATDELCCTLKDKTVGNRIDDTTGGNSGVEPRARRHVHRDGRTPRLFARALCRPGFDQRGQDHGPLSAEGRDRGRQRRRYRHPRSRRGAARCALPICTRPTTRPGKVTTSSRGRSVTILRGKVMVENGQYFGSPNDGRYLKRKISSEILNGARALSAAPTILLVSCWRKACVAWRVAGSVAARRRRRARDRRERARTSGSIRRRRI